MATGPLAEGYAEADRHAPVLSATSGARPPVAPNAKT